MDDERVARLIREAAEHRYSRRDVLRRAVALGLGAPAIAAVLAACGSTNNASPSSGGSSGSSAGSPSAGGAKATSTTAGTGGYAPQSTAVITGNTASPVATIPTGDAANPLNVKKDAPLDVVIFKGGYGDDYAIHAEQIYAQAYPQAKVSHAGIQRLQEQLQPRFVGGNPPDVIDNSGAGNLDTAGLVAEGQLAELTDLMNAPSFDTAGKKFSETLLPGSQFTGLYNGKQMSLQYVYSVYGIWYSDTLFKQKGWTYPDTWDKMLAMCEDIKKSGTSPWTYQGKYPQYMLFLLNQFAYKNGGMDVILNLDNLQPNAWKQPAVKAAAEALYQLADKDYIMPGTAGLTHTESQAQWLQGKAIFIPCGSWLENEIKGLIPDNFNMVVKPTPSLNGDKLPFTAIQAAAGEEFIVPSKGKNVPGGKEFLRILFSKQGARFFSQNTKSLTVVQGSADGLELGSAFASVLDASKAAGDNTFIALYPTWYKKLYDEANNQMGAMMTKQISPDDFINKVQDMADQVAKDDSIKKFKREK